MTARDIGKLVGGEIEAAKRRRQKPSERNLRIHHLVRVEGDDPLEIAALHEISRRRVAAICQQVDRWYGEQEPSRLGELQGAAAEQAARLVAKRRLEYVYSWAVRGLRNSGQTRVEGETILAQDGSRVDKQKSKDHHFNVQWLKVAKGTAEQLLVLAKEEQQGEAASSASAGLPSVQPGPPLPGRTGSGARRIVLGEAMLRAAACLRRAIRQKAQQGGPEEIGKLIEQVVLACLGERPPQAAPDATAGTSHMLRSGSIGGMESPA